MNVYIWKYIDKCSDSYHSGGGVTVIAASEQRARELANAEDGCSIKLDEMPDIVQAVMPGAPEVVVIFPDAGCC